MLDRIVTPVIAVGLAFLVWMYTRSRDEEVLDRYEVPVELQVAPAQADQYELEVSGPGQVRVSFAGPPSRIRELRGMLQQGLIRITRTVSVPEKWQGDARYTDVLRFDPLEVPVPPGVRAVIPESQNRVTVTLRRIVEKTLPIQLVHTAGDRIERVQLDPPTAVVRGPQEVLERVEHIPTQLYTVPSSPGGTEPVPLEAPVRVPLVTTLGGAQVQPRPGHVAVRFTFKPPQRVYELVDVPVHFLCPANFPYRPQFASDRAGRITLKVIGPPVLQRPTAAAYIDLTGDRFQRGSLGYYDEPIRVQLPPGFHLDQEPPRLSVKLVPLDAAAKAAEIGLNP
jgi:hypothetical protein